MTVMIFTFQKVEKATEIASTISGATHGKSFISKFIKS